MKFVPMSEFTGSTQQSPAEVSASNVVAIEKELAQARKFVENTPETKVKLQKQLKENVATLEKELEAEKARVLEYGPDGKRKVKQ
jgi:flagellar motility protein MotE (MotC chaperone)